MDTYFRIIWDAEPGSVQIVICREGLLGLHVPLLNRLLFTARYVYTGAPYRLDEDWLPTREQRRVYSLLRDHTIEELAATGPRNAMEGRNGYLKNTAGVAIADAGTRRMRGWAKQLLALTIKLAASNIHVITAWLDHGETTKPAKPPRATRADKRPEILGSVLRPGAPPLRIVGHKPDSIKRKAA